MSILKWDAQGAHKFEVGVSNGVLYPMSSTPGTYGKGVVWNGLSSVSQNPEGAEETAIYADNIKYLSIYSAEDFKASIEAYTYPDEFAECDGSAELVTGTAGVYIDQQSRKSFAFSYQTKIGSDANQDLGYKIHIIYGCMASPSERSYETVNDSPEAITFSWEISSIPVTVTGKKPTAHLVIDSTKFVEPAALAKLQEIKDNLYGRDPNPEVEGDAGIEPHVLTPDQIAAILNRA